jgi:adenylate kinase
VGFVNSSERQNDVEGGGGPRLVLIGPPASGKGTQAEKLYEVFGVPTVSTGAMLRQEIESGSDLGKDAARYLDRGHLLPDELMLGVVGRWLETRAGGFILDGFPRTVIQAEAFDEMLREGGGGLTAAIFLDTAAEVLEDRVCKRMHCSRCGAIVRVGVHVEDAEAGCPKCGAGLVKREDDTVETFRERMAEYEEKTFPGRGYYEGGKKRLRIRGDGGAAVVCKIFLSGLEALTGD